MILPINEIYTCIQGEGKYAGVPHILIRFSGCRLRCQFKDSFCDTSHNSWKPEKGAFEWKDLCKIYEENPQIKHTMVTGGGPTLHEEILQKVVEYARYTMQHHVTIETEGSEYVETWAQAISLSPKLSNSIPRLGDTNPYTNQVVTQRHIDQHNKWRKEYAAMKLLISKSPDYWLKFVCSSPDDLLEINETCSLIGVEKKNKVYLMPEGVTEQQLQEKRQWLMELCVKEGFNYTDRLHVIAYGDRRGV